MFKKKRGQAEEPMEEPMSVDNDSLDYNADGMEYDGDDMGYDEDMAYEDAGEYDGYDEDVVYDDDYDGEYYDEDYEDYYDEEDQGGPRPKSLKRTVAYMLSVLVASVVLAVVMWFAADDVLALTKPDNVVTITINQGDTLEDVAQNLKDHGLINYKFLFVLYGKFSNAEEKIGTGTFELNQQFDYHALVYGLASSSESRKTVTLTFPEGYTCDQIFEILAENGVCTLEELEDTAANYEFDYDFLADLPYGEPNRLEGYLFPDTYEFYVDDDPERVINKFLSNLSGKMSDEMLAAIDELNAFIRQSMEEEGTFTEEEIENSMMDVYKVLTVASLIEKEAGSDQERSLISSVIYNRLTTHVHELLQIDATVEYALGEHKTELTANDLAVDNPYNTYKYKGLPPGPIANPGLASIMAAIYPEESDYFFYALDTDGTHRFFETYMDQQDFLDGVEPESDDAEETDVVEADGPAEVDPAAETDEGPDIEAPAGPGNEDTEEDAPYEQVPIEAGEETDDDG